MTADTPLLIARRGVLALAVAAFPFLSLRAAEGDAAKAQAVVNRLHEALLAAMKSAAALKFQGRAEALAPVLTETFNLPLMARVAVGPGWKDLTEDQQRRFTDAFTRMTIATYANRFDGYAGESFETLPEAPAQQNGFMVQTRLNRTDGQPPVALNYLMRQEKEGGYRIVDVYLSGAISELATRRSEYSTILKRDGVEKLIEGVEARVKALSS
ncbi:MAG: ABC transporter substrate-binding protein [Elsteraceae bacterium]